MNVGQALSGALRYMIKDGMWRALKHRDYALFAGVNSFSTVGLWVQRLGIQWLAWDLTHSFAWLGAVAFGEAVAVSLVMPLGGSLVDRWDRLLIARVCQSLATLIAALMAVLTMMHLMSIWMLMALMAVGGLNDGVWTPARLALIPSRVPREDLPAAIGLGSVLFNLSQFIGPAIAGILIAQCGVGSTFAVNAMTYVGTLIVLFFIRLRPSVRPKETAGGLIGGFAQAARYAFGHKALGPLIILSACVSLLLRPYRELLAGYADGIFDRGVEGLSLLASTSGLAAAASSIFIANFGRTKGLTRIVLISMLINAGLLTVFALTPSFTLALFAVAGMAALLTIIGISSQILVQSSVPDHLRGRVMSLWGLQLRGVIPLGAWIMGLSAGVIGFQATLLAAAVLFMLCWFFFLSRGRDIAALERAEQPAE